jgi:hypothetical protein
VGRRREIGCGDARPIGQSLKESTFAQPATAKNLIKGPSNCQKAIGWLRILRSGFGDEAEGFGAVIGVVAEGLVERVVATRLDERENRVAQQGEVFGSTGLASHAAVFAPNGGILAPVVLVFHRPVLAANLGEPGIAGIAFAQGGEEMAGLVLEVSGVLLFAVMAGDAHQLPRSWKQGGIWIKIADAQFAPFDASVGGLVLGGPVGGTWIEFVFGELLELGLVVLEREENLRPGAGRDQRRFFGSAARRR